MDSQPLTWHWLKPVLVSSFVFVALSAAILGSVLQMAGHRRLARLPNWLRWVLILPSAFAISWVAEIVPRVLFSIVEISVNHHLLFRPGFDIVIWQLFAPIFFVLAGLQVAPARQLAVFFALAGLKAAVAVINLTTILRFTSGGGGWDQLDPMLGSPLWWNAIVYVVTVLLLVTLGVALIRYPPRSLIPPAVRTDPR